MRRGCWGPLTVGSVPAGPGTGPLSPVSWRRTSLGAWAWGVALSLRASVPACFLSRFPHPNHNHLQTVT